MIRQEITNWLLRGDVSIQYQVYRDLLSTNREDLRGRIATGGWGAEFLSKRKADGHWGKKYYQPKWTSSHYTLLDLKNLSIVPHHPLIRESVDKIAREEKGPDGGVNPSPNIKESDVCLNGMFLNIASYFMTNEEKLTSVIDFILSQRMPDGGFNCRFNRTGAVHSSLHSTLSVLEGLAEYERSGYTYRMNEIREAEKTGKEFILMHRLFISDRTGEIITRDFLRFPYPSRWRYDILRALDYFRYSETPWDERMKAAMGVLLKKRNNDLTWNMNAHHPGQVHFDMECPGKPSRWNTLRALRVLKHFTNEFPE